MTTKRTGLLLGASMIAALAMAAGTRASAQTPWSNHDWDQLSGLINDYAPSPTPTDPWEIHGVWSLQLRGASGKGDFSAEVTMEFSNADNRMQHTHHITMTGANVSYDTSVCPANNPATSPYGLVLTGSASVTGNGSPASFQLKNGVTTLSPLQVCVTGGSTVAFSNVTLVFQPPASGHFGTQAIHGVVRFVR